MKKHSIIIAVWFMFLCGASFAQNVSTKTDDETAIRAVIQSLADAWTAGDGKKFAVPFVEDADFVVWNGLYLKGREAIAQGHQQIFDTIFKETKLQIGIRKIRFLGDRFAVVHAEGSVVKKSEEFPKNPLVAPIFVLSRENGKWQIVAFQNTRLQQTGEK